MAGEIFHWNVNGLKCKRSPNYSKKIDIISSHLENSNSTMFFNIQETHIDSEELPPFLDIYTHIYNFEKTVAREGDPYSGIILCIRKTEEILKSEVIENGRLLYVQTRNIASKEILNVFSVYLKSSNSLKQREVIGLLREKILNDHSIQVNNIIIGDFNFVTSTLDRNSQCLNRIDSETGKVWCPFESEINIQDSFRITNTCRRLYSYNSNRDKRISSRIDRIYVSSSLSSRILSSVFIPNKVSDHKIIKVRFALKIDKGPGMWVFNNQLLKNSVFTESIKAIIHGYFPLNGTVEGEIRDIWDIMKQAIISFTKEFAKNRAARSNKSFNDNKKELSRLENLHPQKITTYLLERMEILKEEIDKHQQIKITGSLLRSKFPTFEEIEPNISFLRSLEKKRGEENTIYSIFDEITASFKTETSDIKESIYNFYRDLYKKDPEDTSEQDQFLNTVNIKINENEKLTIDAPLGEGELYESLLSLQPNKTPGSDGLTREFYIHFWETLKTPYMTCIEEISEKQELSEMQKRGAIKISFKKGDRLLIKNYRPITLLNTDLKIITKALAKRLSSVLPKLINISQTCVSGRHIENNIHIVQNLIDHINETDGQLALIFIDQEKAFDRMSHTFILKTLKKFGIGDDFIRWVSTICKGTKSFVKVNGYETYEFDIERGVRQGCPLSALLYVLTAEVLSTYIRQNNNIKGFRYGMENLQPLEHKIVQYADDNCVGVSSMTSLKELFVTLNKFEKATNARVNKNKTKALWVGKWIGRLDKPLNLSWTSDHVKFLGIYIGNKVGANGSKFLSEMNYADQIEKIKNKITYWKGKGISLCGRVRVMNILILSRLWYRTNILNVSSVSLKKIESMVRDYIWEDKKGARVRQGVLQLEYDMGGLQLVDISVKTKVQRVKRIFYLLALDKSQIDRYLADSLIGSNSKFGQNGLSFGLISNANRIKLVKNDYYKSALEVTNSLDIILRPASMKSIRNEPLFFNPLLRDNNNNNRIFTFSRFKNQMPKLVGDIRPHTSSNIFEVNEKIRKIKLCLSSVEFTNKSENEFLIKIANTTYDVSKVNFKTIYKIVIDSKSENREWENKWGLLLGEENLNWKEIWEVVHDKTHNLYVRSAQWEMLHLNFWSGFKSGERCCLCKEIETENCHIVNTCAVLKYTIRIFKLQLYSDKSTLTFGVKSETLCNFILFHIKSVVFRSRFRNFNTVELCKRSLVKNVKIILQQI